ncbi:MAG: serine/threonine-protein kinase, partial [Phycisphaerales bacterium]|nr:serine/threonine-protein kinase [Phycisphaerales bacterium]
AQIYEAGTYDDGSGARPFFAMEYVAGAKELNDYVADNDIDQRTRLELFCAACEGVEYGHRRGVIHRDLKPGNILVDEVGNPKIIDFGVARSTDSDSVSATLATEAGQLIGTLQYMSPEQVELDPGELDTRSDVYALGVMLYELLVDRMPYDLTGTSLTQAASRIREIQPRRLGEINASLKGDLETICLKALEKDREQRYQSVNDLAEDVRRYLSDEPIMARPPTRTEQIRRFVRKNKAASIATCVAGTALIGLLLVLILFAVGAMLTVGTIKKQRDAAEQARQYADTQRTLAEEKTAEVQKQAEEMQVMLDFQADRMSKVDAAAMGASLQSQIREQFDIDPEVIAGADFTGMSTGLIFDHILKPTYWGIKRDFADQPAPQAELFQRMAYTLQKFTLLDEALAAQRQALELRRSTLGDRHLSTAESVRAMSRLLNARGEYSESIEYNLEAIELYRDLLGDEHDTTREARNLLATTQTRLGQYSEAIVQFNRNLEHTRSKYGDKHLKTAGALHRLAFAYAYQGAYAAGLRLNLEALDIRLPIVGKDDCKITILNIGFALISLGRYEEAKQYTTDALEILRRLHGEHYEGTLWAINNMGIILRHQRKYEEAMEYTSMAVDNRRETLGDEHQHTLQSINCMGKLLQDLGHHQEAMVHFSEALDAQRRTLGDLHLDTLTSIHDVGWLHHEMGHQDEAMAYLSEAMNAQHHERWRT